MGNKKPLILYVKGNVKVLLKPNIAVIGTRKPSKNSIEFEEKVIKTILDDSDKAIVSGLALGCDKVAHQTTVDLNKTTVAVLPSGVNVIKPAKHKKLAQDIINAGGCLVSEYEPNKSVTKGSYVERDAIVAALSDELFVVECGIKSGTMHTVDADVKYQKPICTYIPQGEAEGDYSGNIHISKNKPNSFEINDASQILDKKQVSKQTTLL